MQRVERLRGRAGQRQRERRLRRTNGLCEMCTAEGITRPADVVDHIRPLALGGSDEDRNTRNLCHQHHDQVTAEQFGHQVARRTGGVTASGRPTDADHAWNQARPPAGQPTPPGGRKSPTPVAGHRAVPPCATRRVPE